MNNIRTVIIGLIARAPILRHTLTTIHHDTTEGSTCEIHFEPHLLLTRLTLLRRTA